MSQPPDYKGAWKWVNIHNGPSLHELRELFAALMWTTALQPDLTDFLTKYPELKP